MFLVFVYCIFVLVYLIFVYFRLGIVIFKLIIVGWYYYVVKFCWKNLIIIILLVFCIFVVC